MLKIPRNKLLEYDGSEKPVVTGSSDELAELVCFARVVTFIRGECFDEVDKSYLTPRLLYDVGHCIGQANAILEVSTIEVVE